MTIVHWRKVVWRDGVIIFVCSFLINVYIIHTTTDVNSLSTVAVNLDLILAFRVEKISWLWDEADLCESED